MPVLQGSKREEKILDQCDPSLSLGNCAKKMLNTWESTVTL